MKFWSMIATAVHWYFDVHKKSEKIRKLLLSMKTFDDSFFTMFINRISEQRSSNKDQINSTDSTTHKNANLQFDMSYNYQGTQDWSSTKLSLFVI